MAWTVSTSLLPSRSIMSIWLMSSSKLSAWKMTSMTPTSRDL